MTSSRLQTLADGSPIPDSTSQSPKTPFQIGVVQQVSGTNQIYAYSGMVLFDITAAATYPLLNFTLDRDAMFHASFGWSGEATIGGNFAIGLLIAIDGINVFRSDSRRSTTAHDQANPTHTDILIPAGRNCICSVLNIDGSASTSVFANLTLNGNYVGSV